MLSSYKICVIVREIGRHTWRISEAFKNTSCQFICIPFSQAKNAGAVDLLLVDAEINEEFTLPKAELTVLFDLEDSTDRIERNAIYYMLKDSVKHYAKLGYKLSTADEDGIESVGLPLVWTRTANTIANHAIQVPLHHNNAVPIFIGSPTFLGRHSSNRIETNYLNFYLKMERRYKDTNAMPAIDPGHLSFNQRVDWLADLKANNMPYVGGLVASGGNLSIEWQTEHFGNVEHLFTDRVHYNVLISQMLAHKIHLVPAGHSRWGPRLYDCMATGGVMVTTDLSDDRVLHPPQFCIEVDDSDSITDIINCIRPDLAEFIDHSRENIEYLKTLTPDKIVMDFLKEVGVND